MLSSSELCRLLPPSLLALADADLKALQAKVTKAITDKFEPAVQLYRTLLKVCTTNPRISGLQLKPNLVVFFLLTFQ